jgi:hypothetical protein
MIPCDYCRAPFEPVVDGQRFCCPKHKAAWHRENVPHGTVTSVRQLKRGGYAVTARYEALPPGLTIGGAAWHEIARCTGTDERQGDGIEGTRTGQGHP